MRNCWGAVAVLGLIFLVPGVQADDSALEGVGGTVRPLRRHPSVRMLAEDVTILLPAHSVNARFWFRNDGPATTVLMGFPEEGKTIMAEARHSPPLSSSYLVGFRSRVDGAPIRVRRRVAQPPSEMTNDYYRYWWVKSVPFQAGQTHIVTDRFRGGWYVTGYGVEGFRYILKSGAAWKGPIGRARVRLRLPPLPVWARVVARPSGYRRRGSWLSWDLRNFKPHEDIDIRWNLGFFDIRVNGNPPPAEDFGLPIEGHAGWPELRGSEVWISLRAAVVLLHLKIEGTPGEVVRLNNGRRWAEFRHGSARVVTADGSRELPGPVIVENGLTLVPLSALVRTLGGRATLEHRRRLWITLPPGAK